MLLKSMGLGVRKKECPAMKGFETNKGKQRQPHTKIRKKECPAMKGFETIDGTVRIVSRRL